MDLLVILHLTFICYLNYVSTEILIPKLKQSVHTRIKKESCLK